MPMKITSVAMNPYEVNRSCCAFRSCPETLVGGLSDPQARDGRKSTRYWETKHGIFEFDMTLSTVINNVLIWLDLDRDNVR